MPVVYDPEAEMTHLRTCLEQSAAQVLALAKERDQLRAELQLERNQRRRAEDDVTHLLVELANARKACRRAETERRQAQSGTIRAELPDGGIPQWLRNQQLG